MVDYTSRVLVCSVVCFISLCVLAAGAHARFRDRDFHENNEVVFPRRVTNRGEFLSYYLPTAYERPHHIRKKVRPKLVDEFVHYVVPLRGLEHHVELQPNLGFMSPGMVIENHRKDIKRRRIKMANGTQCHYTGFVRGDKDSKVAISTCQGLSGYVRTKRHYFFIEPASGHRPTTRSAHPHFIRMNRNISGSPTMRGCSDGAEKTMGKRGSHRLGRDDLPEDKCDSELHIETLVVLDRSMLDYHKEIDLENYILTVFNMASDLFHDASLGINIDLAIVRLIRLEEEDHEMNMNVNRDPEKTLDHFREWQSRVNPKDDSHPNHHDVAVLITRIDICGSESTCGVLGASKFGGMCDPLNQAAICEDSGLRLGFVIAHEIAHTLAIIHDTVEESGCCGIFVNKLTTVMEPSISTQTAGWSKCSNKYLNLFIESGFGKCLFDPPMEHSFKLVDILPGVMYDGDFQCKEIMGPNSALCMTGIDCENLICYIEDKGCVETHEAVAPGTKCGDKKWCYHGECIEIGEREEAVNGGWGSWSEWSECSRTCGSGVAWQERHCDSPAPANGGRYCYGEKKRHRICATESCDASMPSFRDVQCSEFNSWVYPEDGKVHSWKNYAMHDENPCVLFCINDWGDIASLRPRVVDGTSCQRGMRDICIDGLCKEIPCDLNLESNAVEDVCGVCRGDSTTCDVYKGEITVPCCGHIKEEKVMSVPRDASNIKVEEMMPTESRVQIRNANGETVFIVGNVFGTFNVPGTYAWVGNIRTRQEAIAIPGPLADEISIWLVVTENVTIIYSYGMPAKNKRTPTFSWDYLEWAQCSAACGPGVQQAIPSCVEKVGGQVDDKYCVPDIKPAVQIRPCEITPCIYRWFVGEWGPCTRCPRGRRHRTVKCIRPTGEGEGEVVFIADSNCVGPKPKSSETCSCLYPQRSRSQHKRGSVGEQAVDIFTPQSHHNGPGLILPDVKIDITGIQPPVIPNDPKVSELVKNINMNLSHGLESLNDEKMNAATSPVMGTSESQAPLLGDFGNQCASMPDTEYEDDDGNDDINDNTENNLATTLAPGVVTICVVLNVTTTTRPTTTTSRVTTTHTTTTTTECSVVIPEMVNIQNEKMKMCSKIAALMGKTIVDKENIANLRLTIHTELENGKIPAGLPLPQSENDEGKPSYTIMGKAALKFLSKMQRDFENNKTKIK